MGQCKKPCWNRSPRLQDSAKTWYPAEKTNLFAFSCAHYCCFPCFCGDYNDEKDNNPTCEARYDGTAQKYVGIDHIVHIIRHKHVSSQENKWMNHIFLRPLLFVIFVVLVVVYNIEKDGNDLMHEARHHEIQRENIFKSITSFTRFGESM